MLNSLRQIFDWDWLQDFPSLSKINELWGLKQYILFSLIKFYYRMKLLVNDFYNDIPNSQVTKLVQVKINFNKICLECF